jgi:hypothetical protein
MESDKVEINVGSIYLSLPSIVKVVKSWLQWAQYVAQIGRQEVHTEFLWGNLLKRGHLASGNQKGGGDNIKMDVRDIDCENQRWMELVQNHIWW